jgi:hypothetical protein
MEINFASARNDFCVFRTNTTEGRMCSLQQKLKEAETLYGLAQIIILFISVKR